MAQAWDMCMARQGHGGMARQAQLEHIQGHHGGFADRPLDSNQLRPL
jgi:hypothetical protein